MFGAYETQYGLPSGFLARTAQIESAFNPMARNPNSSAGGLFQFIDSTAQQYGLEDRFDPTQATDAAARLARDNAAMLRRTLGREPTAAELYLAHQQGGGGASNLLANPNARAVDVVGIDAVRLNGGDENMTAGQFASKWLNKFDQIEGGAGSDTLAGGLSILPNRPDRLEDNAMQPEKSGGLLGGLWDKTGLDEERRAMLAMALSGMSMRPNQGLQAAAQMKMKNASDRKTRNKTIDWLQSRGRDDLARAVASGALDGRSAAQLAMAPAQDERTALMQNVEYIMENNPGMSFNDALAQARSGVTVNNNAAPQVGTIPQGYQLSGGEGEPYRMEPIPGGPADTTRQREAQAESATTQADTVLSTVAELKAALGKNGIRDIIPDAGIVGDFLARNNLNQEAVDVRNKIATLESAVAFDRLQRMREASPTGGALGAVSERELTLLAADMGSLKQSSSPQEIVATLDRIEKRYSEIMRKFSAYPGGQQPAPPQGGEDPLGLR